MAVRPLRNGVISDFGVTLDMLRLFIKKWAGKQRFHNMRMVVCVPSGVTEVEKRAVLDAAREIGAKEVHIIEEPRAAALGAGLDIGQPRGHMVVDIGGGTTDIAVISLGRCVISESVKLPVIRWTKRLSSILSASIICSLGRERLNCLKSI